jgi:transglutaminase/protease-like cytokinesis protein 3
LYQWFLDWVDIETVIISGHIRDERNQYVELDIDDNYRHAWNAIKLNGNWRLIDTTWGTSNDDSQSEFYFDIKPQLLINTHYPENSKWQLLKKPLSLEEFNNSKFVKLTWFFSGFSDIPKLKKDNNYYYFMYKTNTRNKNLSVKLEISNDNLNFKPIKNTFVIDQDGITYVRFEKKGIPKKGFYKVNLHEFDYPFYLNIISFKTE